MRKRIALYDPYLDVMGGGERHILSIVKVLNEDTDLDIFWDSDLSREIEKTLDITLKNVRFVPAWKDLNTYTRAQKLAQYDAFFYVTDGSYFFSRAKKNVIFCMVPQKSLYTLSPLNRLKTLNASFICNSLYTSKWLSHWGIDADVIYPFIDDQFIEIPQNEKKKKTTILSVGRFFKHLHSKRQDIAIQYFIDLKKTQPYFKDYTLILPGSLKEEDMPYFHALLEQAKGRTDIILKPNCSFTELLALYKSSEVYWHFAGYGIDSDVHPEQVEHLGITPLEAMASGCLTYAYAAGGPSEVITHEKTGYLFTSQEKLFALMNESIPHEEVATKIRHNAREYVIKTFSYTYFENQVKRTISV